MSIRFLTVEAVLEIHRDQIDHYGGSPGIRDQGLLESALAAPAASFGGKHLHGDVFDIAAAYLFHIVMNHPFIDGNKRTAALAPLIFLELNGVEVVLDETSYENLILRTIEHQIGKEEISQYFHKLSHF